MSEFFRDGGVAMTPVLLFGALGVAAAVLWLLRRERRYLWLMLALATTSVATGPGVPPRGMAEPPRSAPLRVPAGNR